MAVPLVGTSAPKGLCQSFFCAPQCMSMNAWMWGVLPEKWWDGGARVLRWGEFLFINWYSFKMWWHGFCCWRQATRVTETVSSRGRTSWSEWYPGWMLPIDPVLACGGLDKWEERSCGTLGGCFCQKFVLIRGCQADPGRQGYHYHGGESHQSEDSYGPRWDLDGLQWGQLIGLAVKWMVLHVFLKVIGTLLVW